MSFLALARYRLSEDPDFHRALLPPPPRVLQDNLHDVSGHGAVDRRALTIAALISSESQPASATGSVSWIADSSSSFEPLSLKQAEVGKLAPGLGAVHRIEPGQEPAAAVGFVFSTRNKSRAGQLKSFG